MLLVSMIPLISLPLWSRHSAEALLPACEVRRRNLCHLRSCSLRVLDNVLVGKVVARTLRRPRRPRPRGRGSFLRRLIDCRFNFRGVLETNSYFLRIEAVDRDVLFLCGRCSRV